ncbi:sri-11 [Pristionchus pacificus]|uniref:Sri-11 n=1 Tax=Pristionchus pacificus TaxID=54126 RepID=A0A2A6CJI3_PRIPA|nr:sri-11 [Pristionchus pacificus]|eukprot:PDM78266.1 sri-11 [Pristionchus pacificus]
MGINFTVGEEAERFVGRSLHCITAVSFPISLLTIRLLWTKTPKDAGAYKYLLMIMQAFSALIELHMGVLFAPIPLFPLMGAYCTGILCDLHVPPHMSTAILFFIVLGCFIMLNVCIFYRHQAIIPDSHPLKMRNRTRILVCSIYAVAVELLSVLVLFADHDSSGGSDFIEKNHPSMKWVYAKPGWIVWNPEGSVRFVVYHALINHTFQAPLISFLIHHSLKVLNQRAPDMSLRTISFHRAMISSLIMQSVCCVFVFLPVTVLVVSIISEGEMTHEVTIVAFLTCQLFTPLHSITVILSSATLRRSVWNYFRFRSLSDGPKISTTVLPKPSVVVLRVPVCDSSSLSVVSLA